MKKYVRIFAGIMLAGFFQNCSNVKFSASNMSSVGAQSVKSGTLTVSASKPNPPLDIFFVIDSSGSMLDHQIDLGRAFQNIFNSNAGNLSNFGGNIYLFSTASTINADSA